MSFTLEQAFFSRDSRAGLGIFGCSTEDNSVRNECDKIGGQLRVTEEEAEYIIKNVKEVVEYLRGFSPIWRDLVSGKKAFIL